MPLRVKVHFQAITLLFLSVSVIMHISTIMTFAKLKQGVVEYFAVMQ